MPYQVINLDTDKDHGARDPIGVSIDAGTSFDGPPCVVIDQKPADAPSAWHPCLRLTPSQARFMARALNAAADEAEQTIPF